MLPNVPKPYLPVSLLLLTMSAGCLTRPADQVPVAPVGIDQAAGTDLDLVYDETVVHRYELDIAADVWANMLADPLSDEYQHATFRCGEEVYEDVGIRFKGNSSRWMVEREGGTRYSFKIKLDEFVDDQSFHGVKTLNLHNATHDPSFMKERLAYDLFRENGVPASRVAYVDVYLNGELHGLYVSVEQVGKSFLREWFGDDTGNLYKPEGGDFLYKGPSIEDYGPAQAYELKTNEDEADYRGLIHLLDVLNNTPAEQFESAIAAVFDVETFLAWLAMNTLLVNLDSYAGSMAHNFYIYDNPSTGQFVFMPWDLNEAFGTFTCGYSNPQLLRLPLDAPFCQANQPGPAGGGSTVSQRPLITRILAVERFHRRYLELLSQFAAGAFGASSLASEIGRWRDLIAEHVRLDPTKESTYEQFVGSLNPQGDPKISLPRFAAERATYVSLALAGEVQVSCGDEFCDIGETCASDCQAVVRCSPCQVLEPRMQRCVPSCAEGCSCPTDAPVALVCDTTLYMCRPAGS